MLPPNLLLPNLCLPRSMAKRTQYLTSAVAEGKASAQAYKARFASPKL